MFQKRKWLNKTDFYRNTPDLCKEVPECRSGLIRLQFTADVHIQLDR